MMDRQRFTVTELVIVLLVLWLGFAIHNAPQFAGSLTGGALALIGASLMVLVPIAYGLIKGIPPLRRLVTRAVSMRALLVFHVYTAVLGAILAVLHTGHKLINSLGIAVLTSMLAAVVSGYIARYFLGFVAEELHEQQTLLSKLQVAYQSVAAEIGAAATTAAAPAVAVADKPSRLTLGTRAKQLSVSIADVEYSIKTHTVLKRRASRWLKLHAIVSGVFYLLLTLHVWAVLYFGIRWLQ